MDGQRDLFSIDIQYVKGVGPKRAELFSKLGIDSVGALLQFYPCLLYTSWPWSG